MSLQVKTVVLYRSRRRQQDHKDTHHGQKLQSCIGIPSPEGDFERLFIAPNPTGCHDGVDELD